MNRRWTAARLHERRRGRQLATEIAAAIDQAEARRVLITSARRGDGKSQLADTLRRELAMMGQRRITVLGWTELAGLHPDEFDPQAVILIDGPAMLEGEEIFSLPPAWLEAFDASLVVLMKRVTTKAEVLDLTSWLEAAGAAPIGLVWNEHAFPPLTAVLRRVRDWVADVFERPHRAALEGKGAEDDDLAHIVARATGSHGRIEPENDPSVVDVSTEPPPDAQATEGEQWSGAERWIPPWVAQRRGGEDDG